MTPEREAEIREWTAQKQHCEFYGSHWLMASDLLAEIDSLREAAKHVTTVFHDERKGDIRLAIDSLSVALEEK